MRDTGLVTGDGNGRCGSSDTFSDTASDTGPANVEAWKLLGSLLSQIGSRGLSDSECLSWLREKTQGCVARKNKRGAPEARDSERITRPRLGRLDGTDAETVEDGCMSAGDRDDDDDEYGSDWGAGDDSDCSSDTDDDIDEEDRQALTTVFQVLQRRAASNMALCTATQNSPSANMPNMAFSAEQPPPPYTSRANSPQADFFNRQ